MALIAGAATVLATGGVEAELIDILAVFIIAGAVGVLAAKYARVPYTIALLVAGFIVSLSNVNIGISLTHDIILLVLLPPLLFEGAATTDFDSFRANFPLIGLLAIVGLLLSVVVIGITMHFALGFPILVALLFAAMVFPTDPVSVLALFEEVGAPERLSVLVEGESLLNDGVGVVVFTVLLGLIQSGTDPAALLNPSRLGGIGVEMAFSSVGGAAVGLLSGYAIYRVMVSLDEHMTEIVLTIVLAYGSFLLAEHYLHVSGVIATVAAGLFIGNRGREYAMSAQTKISVFNTWATGAFIVNTFIFLVLGAQTPIRQILSYSYLLLPALALVLVGRALAVYPLTALANRFLLTEEVSPRYQHVLLWGGLHASIPIALVLGLPQGVPFREEMRVMVFGVAAFSLVVQGMTLRRLIEGLGITTVTEEEKLYQLLVGRARAIDEVLAAAADLREESRISREVYDRFTSEYERERDELAEVIGRLLSQHPELRRRERLIGERQLLKRERAAIQDAEFNGLLSSDVADGLLREVDLKIERVRSGETTVLESEVEGYNEYWRQRAAETGLLDDTSASPPNDDPDSRTPTD